jgi:hypothetical protein
MGGEVSGRGSASTRAPENEPRVAATRPLLYGHAARRVHESHDDPGREEDLEDVRQAPPQNRGVVRPLLVAAHMRPSRWVVPHDRTTAARETPRFWSTAGPCRRTGVSRAIQATVAAATHVRALRRHGSRLVARTASDRWENGRR